MQPAVVDLNHPLIQLAAYISDQLDEPNFLGVYQLVQVLGPDQAQALLAQTLQIEAAGGQLVSNGQRRRTPGGVFFRLAYDCAGVPRPQTHLKEPFSWSDRRQYLADLLQSSKGRVHSMKVQLNGKPTSIRRTGECVILAMEQPPLATTGIPRGLPQPPAEPTTVTVYVPAKKWSAVVRELSSGDDRYLCVKGPAQFDPNLPGLAVFASEVQVLQKKAKSANPGVSH